jgi:hypothetical protein
VRLGVGEAPVDGEARLIEKLRLIEALFAGAATDGERASAGAARDRIRNRLEAVAALEAPIPYQFTFRDLWSRKVFLALLRRYALKPYRYRGQRYTTVMVKVPKRFVDETLWPEFERLNQSLHAYLHEVTDRVVAEVLHADSSDAAEVEPPQLTAGGPATVGDLADAGDVVLASAPVAGDSASTAAASTTSGSAGRRAGRPTRKNRRRRKRR